jgi:hypothetical protein
VDKSILDNNGQSVILVSARGRYNDRGT